jgi:DNA (cytosine-5)-methyltransferase 1
MGFKYVDLFSGIGGFHLALDQLGGKCVFASEIDYACKQVYSSNFKLVPSGDIAEFSTTRISEIPDHQVLCAGFPCQPFSKSGHQRGMEETRGTLFFEILKILEAKRPRFVILENVRNLAGPRQRDTWETIILNLRRLGYVVPDRPTIFSPHLLSPTLEGRPQIRERAFILAEFVGGDGAWMERAPLVRNESVADWHPTRWSINDWLIDDSEIENLDRYQLSEEETRWICAWDDFAKRLSAEEEIPSFPIWADHFRRRAVFEDDTPPWKINFLEKNAALYRRNPWIRNWRTEWSVRKFPDSRRKFEWQARGSEPDLWQLVMHMRPSGLRVRPPTYLPALVAMNQTSIIGQRRRRITPREAARMQGFPDDFKLHESDSAAYKQLGNAVNVGAVKHVAKALFDASAVGWPSAREVRELYEAVS